ncbi:hypothetical protein EVJ50_01310 [Synechococcus sp. RSCCF101]|uniref:hypothetical protein n=1 Tax=Synechococcus sp. RSCCF101 TaxID=2511069 RepID=UPI001247CFC8|nr:hypothetical protein [Synechococcus sp. RSCCF101]QEY31093.1 hypothetical protein EVJ50_01310 [Synechococcus sp. RSCCF101]
MTDTLPPPWLTDVDHTTYGWWVKVQARRLQTRQRRQLKDRSMGLTPLPQWREAIQEAVIRSGGVDHWTGEALRWDLLQHYDGRQASRSGREYRRRFALMPVLDQQQGALGPALVVCSLRSHGIRGDLTRDEWMAHSWQVLVHQGLLEAESCPGGASDLPADHPEFLKRLSQRMSFHFLRARHRSAV